MDIVVTLPKSFGLAAWISEGDAAGDPPRDAATTLYYWKLGKREPKIKPGERVYVVYNGHLIGYAPLLGFRWDVAGNIYLVRQNGRVGKDGEAVACTIDEHTPGFRGYRYRWWEREDERPFPDWRERAARGREAARLVRP